MGISIAIVDESEQFRMLIETEIRKNNDYRIVSSCKKTDDVPVKLSVSKPDIVIIENESGSSGLDIISAIKNYFPSIRFIVCSNDSSEEKILEAVKAGANGYIRKENASAQISRAIEEVYKGHAMLCGQTTLQLLETIRKGDPQYEKNNSLKTLSDRELQILDLLSKGLDYKKSAENLGITDETVRKHVYSIYSKLGVNNKVEAVNKYYGR